MDDWKPQYHEGECELLSAGKAYEAESRRKLHNNGWYWDYAETGQHASAQAFIFRVLYTR